MSVFDGRVGRSCLEVGPSCSAEVRVTATPCVELFECKKLNVLFFVTIRAFLSSGQGNCPLISGSSPTWASLRVINFFNSLSEGVESNWVHSARRPLIGLL
jgi:hypothetical protein